jgi:hypothetical protein
MTSPEQQLPESAFNEPASGLPYNTQPGPYGTALHQAAEAVTQPNAIAPELGAYLAPILERWRIAKLEADAATERAEALGREVKDACLASGFVGTLTDSSGQPAARVETSTAWRLNTNALKSEHPEVYAAYARQSTSTRLVAVK